jgi:hypothetical protein
MSFIHAREFLNPNQCVRVDCDTQCNVQLLDDTNFSQYKNGNSYRYTGGFFREFPAILVPPCSGFWNVTIDLGGASANIRYSITVITLPS